MVSRTLSPLRRLLLSWSPRSTRRGHDFGIRPPGSHPVSQRGFRNIQFLRPLLNRHGSTFVFQSLAPVPSRRHQCLLDAPAGLQPMPQTNSGNAFYLRPVRHRSFLPIELDPHRHPPVGHLLFDRRPTDVARLVITLPIRIPVQRVLLGRSWTHVLKKGSKAEPPVAHLDPLGPVSPVKSFMLRYRTARYHRRPAVECRVFGAATGRYTELAMRNSLRCLTHFFTLPFFGLTGTSSAYSHQTVTPTPPSTGL